MYSLPPQGSAVYQFRHERKGRPIARHEAKPAGSTARCNKSGVEGQGPAAALRGYLATGVRGQNWLGIHRDPVR